MLTALERQQVNRIVRYLYYRLVDLNDTVTPIPSSFGLKPPNPYALFRRGLLQQVEPMILIFGNNGEFPLDEFAATIAIIYTEKFIVTHNQYGPPYILTNKNLLLLITVCLQLSVKYLQDDFFDNKFIARSLHISLRYFNDQEIATLKALEFELHISPENCTIFQQKLDNLIQHEMTITDAPGARTDNESPDSITDGFNHSANPLNEFKDALRLLSSPVPRRHHASYQLLSNTQEPSNNSTTAPANHHNPVFGRSLHRPFTNPYKKTTRTLATSPTDADHTAQYWTKKHIRKNH